MSTSKTKSWGLGALGALLLVFALAPVAEAQQPQRPPQVIQKDPARVDLLYVSDKWADHPVADYERDMQGKAQIGRAHV